MQSLTGDAGHFRASSPASFCRVCLVLARMLASYPRRSPARRTDPLFLLGGRGRQERPDQLACSWQRRSAAVSGGWYRWAGQLCGCPQGGMIARKVSCCGRHPAGIASAGECCHGRPRWPGSAECVGFAGPVDGSKLLSHVRTAGCAPPAVRRRRLPWHGECTSIGSPHYVAASPAFRLRFARMSSSRGIAWRAGDKAGCKGRGRCAPAPAQMRARWELSDGGANPERIGGATPAGARAPAGKAVSRAPLRSC